MAFRCVAGCLLSWFLIVLLASCIGDQQGHQNQQVAPPVINIPPSQKVDTDALRQGIKDDITASSNATASQMTGAVNASISKLAEKLVGLEANLSATITNTATMTNQASAELRAKLDASLTAFTELKASLSMVNEFNAKMENRINLDASLVKDLQAQIGSMAAQMTASANAQVGLYNKIDSKLETVNNAAGRDINYLPKDVTMLMLDQERSGSRTIIFVVSALACVISTAIAWFGKNMINQSNNERRMMNALTMELAGKLQPEDAAKFEHKFALLSKG